MSAPLNLPFPIFRLVLPGNLVVLQPALDWNAVRIGVEVSQLLEEFQSSLSAQVEREQNYLDLLSTFAPTPWHKASLQLKLPHAQLPEAIALPPLEIPYYWQEHPAGWLGLIPGLGVEGVAPSPALLREHLHHLAALEFIRRDQPSSWRDLISASWFVDCSILLEQIPLDLPGVWSPGNGLNLGQHPWLDRIGERYYPTHQQNYGRQEILEKLINLFTEHQARSILLVGPPQVGKTTLILEAIRQLDLRQRPIKVWATTASQMITELSQDQGWEYNLPDLCQEIQILPRYLLLHNLARLFEVGQYQHNPTSMAEFLIPLLSTGQLGLITECTPEEYARIELRAPQFLQAFQVLQLPEPSEELSSIVQDKIAASADRAGCKISTAAIAEALHLHRRFLPYAGLPGRPIRFLEAILQQRLAQTRKNALGPIDRQEIIQFFCAESGLPSFLVDPQLTFDPAKAQAFFQQQVFGQQAAITALVSVLSRVKTDLMRSGKPIASFLFTGPTGVGKTELAKSLARYVFGHANRMLRFDMSEFSNPYAVARLIGTDGSDGLLTTAVRGAPFCLVLFDEIEKAHSSFFDLLLQILDEGRISDRQGRVANFCSAIIIMTSNLGAQERPIHLFPPPSEESNEQVLRAVQAKFRPELLNRIDQIIPFNKLDSGLMRQIVEREFTLLQNREGLKNRKVTYQINPQALDELTRLGFSDEYGARQLQRTLRERIILPLAEKLNQFDPSEHFTIVLEVVDGEFQLLVHTASADLQELMADRQLQSFADCCARLRQMGDHFLEGYSCTQLQQAQNQASIGTAFHNNLPTAVVESFRNLVEHCREIAEYEEALCLQGIQLNTEYSLPDPKTYLDAWETSFFEFKKPILFWANPEANGCFLHLYGSAATVMLTLYLGLIERQNFQAEIMGAWFLPNSPNEGYQFLPWAGATTPTHGKLVGIAIKVVGPGAYWYFQSEGGGQKWWDALAKAECSGLVQVKTRLDFAPNAHRRDFLQGINYRRWVRGQGFKDSNWNLERRVTPDVVELTDQMLSKFQADWIAEED